MSRLLDDSPPLAPVRLEAALDQLGPGELASLARSTGLEIDESKRLTPTQQLARGLASRRQLAHPDKFEPEQQALLIELAAAGGRLVVERVLESAAPLIEGGWLFTRPAARGVELVLPAAYVLQLPPWEGEDRRSVRVLLASLDRSQVSQLARTFDPRGVNLPPSLALESAFVCLRQPKLVRSMVRELAPAEAELLKAVVRQGGEADTEELLDLAREPMRLQVAGTLAPRSGGASFELERRGLLLRLPPNRHLVASEVRDVVGERQQRALALKRTKLRRTLEAQHVEPARARYSLDPAPVTVALALLVAQRKPVRAQVGTPKTLVKQLSKGVGLSERSVALLATLSRKLGLWDAARVQRMVDVDLTALSAALFDLWLSGVGWDEGRVEPELLRAAPGARQPSPSAALRRVVLEDLVELAASCWVPLATFVEYCLADVRAAGLERQLERFVERTGIDVVAPQQAVRTMLLESLPLLGAVDIGAESPSDTGGEAGGLSIRASARVLAWLGVGPPIPPQNETTRYVAALTLRLGERAAVSDVLAAGELLEPGRTDRELELIISRAKVEHAVLAGGSPQLLREHLEALAPLSDEAERLLQSVAQARARVEYVAASGFVWVDDPALLDELRERRALAKLFVEPSPPGGLLVSPGVSAERLSLRLRRYGIELLSEGAGQRLRAVRG